MNKINKRYIAFATPEESCRFLEMFELDDSMTSSELIEHSEILKGDSLTPYLENAFYFESPFRDALLELGIQEPHIRIYEADPLKRVKFVLDIAKYIAGLEDDEWESMVKKWAQIRLDKGAESPEWKSAVTQMANGNLNPDTRAFRIVKEIRLENYLLKSA